MVATATSLAAVSREAALLTLTADLNAEEQEWVQRATERAEEWFEGRKLASGEPIWRHVLTTGLLVSELRLDGVARAAALLYPVSTCTPEYAEWIESELPSAVGQLVAGLSRLAGIRLDLDQAGSPADVEAMRQMVLGLAEDLRVVLIRLASRVATLRWFAEKAERSMGEDFARESRLVYAPLANRLGVWRLKWELEDLAFRILEPDAYRATAAAVEERRLEREAFVAARMAELRELVKEMGISPFEVSGRPKHLYGIYQKMVRKERPIDQIFDTRGVRVLVPTVEDCYAVLGRVHERYMPVEGEFDDYIARPKANGYQSLHTAVRAADGRVFEVQIRTFTMHHAAEFGVAAHWRYKEGKKEGKVPRGVEERVALLRSLVAWRDEVAESSGWAEKTKRALREEVVFVLTPAGRVIDLPAGATPIDFAYRIHTDVGHRCRGARVDGQIVPLTTRLRTGQTVEILTAKEGGPSRDWLRAEYAVTRYARSKIRAWFAHLEEEGRNHRAGRGEENIRGRGQRFEQRGADRSAVKQPHKPLQERSGGGRWRVLVAGEAGVLAQPARCCSPQPGEKIVGFVTRSRGVTLHRRDCAEWGRLQVRFPERVITASWEKEPLEEKRERGTIEE